MTGEAEHRGEEDGRGHCLHRGALPEKLLGEQEGNATGQRGALNTEGRKTAEDTACTMALCRNSRGSMATAQRTRLKSERRERRRHTSECSDNRPLNAGHSEEAWGSETKGSFQTEGTNKCPLWALPSGLASAYREHAVEDVLARLGELWLGHILALAVKSVHKLPTSIRSTGRCPASL